MESSKQEADFALHGPNIVVDQTFFPRIGNKIAVVAFPGAKGKVEVESRNLRTVFKRSVILLILPQMITACKGSFFLESFRKTVPICSSDIGMFIPFLTQSGGQAADTILDIVFKFCEAFHGWEKTPNILCPRWEIIPMLVLKNQILT